MNNNEFIVKLTGSLEQAKTQKQIHADIRRLQKNISMLRITGTFAKGETKKELNRWLRDLGEKLNHVKLKGKIDGRNLKREIDKSLQNVKFKDIDALNVDAGKTRLKLRKVMADIKALAAQNPIPVNFEAKKEKLQNNLTKFLTKNTKIQESGALSAESERIRELISSIKDTKTLQEAADAFRLYESEVHATGYATKSTADKIKSMLSHIRKISGFLGLTSMAVGNFKKSLNTLKSIDTLLTEISKTNDKLSGQDLSAIGNHSFDVASKYGKTAMEYMAGVQEAFRAGYQNAEGIAELSVAAQSAGNMTAGLAERLIMAADEAYQMNGSVSELTTVLDGMYDIASHNAVSMAELSEAMTASGSTAASFGVSVEETAAALGTMIAATRQSGAEAAKSFQSILLHIRQVSDEEAGIDAEGLAKYEAACNALNVQLKETKNGVVSLRDPMEVLRELSVAYNRLAETDSRRTNLLRAVGGGDDAAQLDALLRRWDTYESMIRQYNSGTGSMAAAAEKTADSWEGSLNRLQNSFDSFVNTLVNKQAIIGGISFFDRLIQGTEKLVESLGEIPVMLTALNSAMVLRNKDYGITQIWNGDKKKVDLQGNLFGIDFTAVKNMKNHFSEAEGAIVKWNEKLHNGHADITDFNESVVENSVQLKEYLSACSADAPASLEGYKSHLKAAGVSTDALRLKTVLLNSAVTMLGGFAIQAVITGLYQLTQVSGRAAQKAKESGSAFMDTKSDIDAYKTRIEDLYATLRDSSSSIEDVTAARQSLMAVQDELIDRFGMEKETIDLITQAVDGQTEAFDRLAKKQWLETKNEFNNNDFWGGAGNWLEGYDDNIDRMTDKMENAYMNLHMSTSDYFSGEYDYLIKQLENAGWKYSPSDSVFIKDGNLKALYDEILAIQSLVGNEAPENFLKSLTKGANDAKESLDNYEDMWNSYILYERIFADEGLADSWHDINEAYAAYKDAFTFGSAEDITKAEDHFAQILTQAAKGLDDESVIAYFNGMYPELQQTVGKWNFTVDFEPNTDGLRDKVNTALDRIDGKADGIVSFSAEDIQNFNPKTATQKQLAAYGELNSIAREYSLTIEQLIALLQSMGFVQSANYNRLTDAFGQDNVSMLSEKELEIAYQIENIGGMTFRELQEKIKETRDSMAETEIPLIPTLASSISTLAAQLEPQFTELGSLYNEIFQTDGNGNVLFSLDSIDNTALEKLRKSFAEIGEESGVTFDPVQLEPFFAVLTDKSSESWKVQQAFNDLATAYLYSTGTLEQLNAETANAIKKQLEQMGVANAEAVVAEALVLKNEELALSKKYLAQEGNELVNATDSEVLAFMAEQAATGNCSSALAALQLKKLLVNNTLLNTETDIRNVMMLAQGAGIATESLAELITLEAAYEKAKTEGYTNTTAYSMVADRIKTLKQDFQDEVNNLEFNPTGIKFKAPSGTKTSAASSAATQAKTDWKNVLDRETDLLEKQLAANLITFQDYADKRRLIIEDYYRDSKIKAEDYYDSLESIYHHHLSLYDSVVNTVTDRIDDEIDRLHKQKESIENFYQVRIDAIQEEIDALNKANDTRRQQIDLEKAQYEAERARNQHVNKVYDGSQFVYTSDMEALRNAEDDLADKEFRLNISGLETEIALLKEEMENTAKSLDNQIDALEAYKDKWNEISDVYQKQQDKLLAAEIMGSEWERDILSGRLDILRNFTEQYIALQQAQADAAANAARIKADAAAGNVTDGNVGSMPISQVLDRKSDKDIGDTDKQKPSAILVQKPVPTTSGSVDYKHFNRDVTRIYATMARFHGGLDEGYATAPGQSTPVNPSLALLQKLADENLLPNELPAILQHGELVITPEQQRNIIGNLQQYVPEPFITADLSSERTEGNQTINNYNNFSINCPNVTNNSGAEYILKSLRQLPLDNIQHSHRRRY